jgi:type VI secretion system secreted protein Hcp
MTTRRDFLRAATGLVAATAVGGALLHSDTETAQAKEGAMDMNISVRIEGFSGEFAARALQMGLSSSIVTGGAGGGAGKASFDSIAIEKLADGYSPLLYMLGASGQHVKQVLFTLRDSQGKPIGSITLQDVYVAGVRSSLDGSGSGASMESVSFVYGKISMNYLGSKFSWDVAAAKSM